MKRLVAVFALVLAGLFACLTLMACKKPHEHIFSDAWAHDGTHHWHEATCGHTDAVQKERHSFANKVCTVCGYEEVRKDNHDLVGISYKLNEDEQSYYVDAVGAIEGTELEIPDTYDNLPVTRIGSAALAGNTKIVSVKLSNNITSIDDFAFAGSYIVSIVMPRDLTYLGISAFHNCHRLASITIPDSLERIEHQAFYCCSSLTSITIGRAVTSIGTDAFFQCNKLVEVINLSNLPLTPGLKDSYGSLCVNALVVYNERRDSAAEVVDNFVFYNGDTKYLMSYVGNDSDITLPEYYNDRSYEIYKFAFSANMTIVNVTIPDTVTDIGMLAFNACRNLVSLKLSSMFMSISDSMCISCTKLQSIVIPEGVMKIEPFAFSNCNSLYSVTIGKDVKEIGDSAFRNCYRLLEIYNLSPYIDITLENSKANGEIGVYARDVYTDATTPSKIVEEDGILFYVGYEREDRIANIGVVDKNTKFLVLPDTFRGQNYEIMWGAYLGVHLVSLVIGSGVTSIGSEAFPNAVYEIYNLSEHITLTKGATTNGRVARNAWDIYTDRSAPSKIASDENGYIFYKGEENISLIGYDGTSTELTLPDDFEGKSYEIYDGTFQADENITQVVFGKQVTSIGESAFSDCYNLRTVVFSEGLKTIGAKAFSECEHIAQITVNDGLTAIMESAFEACHGLVDVYLSNSVEIIGNSAFNDCTGLTNVRFGTHLKSIGDDAFSACNLMEIVLPDEVETIGDNAFLANFRATKIVLGNSVTTIGSYAFSRCQQVYSIVLPDSVKTISERAFNQVNGLTYIVVSPNVETVGDDLFANCNYFQYMYITGTKEDVSGVDFGNNASFVSYYREDKPKPDERDNYWHYVDGVPTSW